MSSHWCYRCNKFVTLWRQDMPMCPECESGFVEEIETPNPTARSLNVEGRRRRFPTAAAMYMIGGHHHNNNNGSNSRRRQQYCVTNGDRPSQFNPIIMLRGGSSTSHDNTEERNHGFELFYEDVGNGNGLQPLPPRMSDFLLGSEFQRVMEQLSHVEANRSAHERHNNHLPAAKAAVESLSSIQINDTHLGTESHCAVCKEAFELGVDAKEMPCKHLYHPECILPWLEIRNSCPVCRHELPCEQPRLTTIEEENVGLTVWRLPGGGFAVGRFSRELRNTDENNESERELPVPVVYTEVDGGFNVVGEPRRVSWSLSTSSSSSSSRRRGGGLRRMLGGMFRCLRTGARPHHRSVSTTTTTRVVEHNSYSQPLVAMRSNSVSRPTNTNDENESPSPHSRSRRTWSMEVNSGMRSW